MHQLLHSLRMNPQYPLRWPDSQSQYVGYNSPCWEPCCTLIVLCFQALSHICQVPLHTRMHIHTLNSRTTKWNFIKLYIRAFYGEFSSHFNFGYLSKNNSSLGNLNTYLCAPPPPAHIAYTRVFQLMVCTCLRSPPVQQFCRLQHKSFLPLDVHNLSFTAITVKLMFLTNVYTDLINTVTDYFLHANTAPLFVTISCA